MAEGTGFEPVWRFRANGLANRPLKPLGQPSTNLAILTNWLQVINVGVPKLDPKHF